MDVRDFELTTARFRIRHWQKSGRDDNAFVDTVLELLTPEVRRTLPDHWQAAFTRDRALEWLSENDDHLLVVTRIARHEPVAFLLVYASDEAPDKNTYRIGYLVAESAWGKGVATEALLGLVEFCGRLAPVTLLAGVEPGNAASRRVLEKCGFTDTTAEKNGQRSYSLAIGH